MAKKKRTSIKQVIRRTKRATPTSASLTEQFEHLANQKLQKGKALYDRALKRTKDRAIVEARRIIADAEEALQRIQSNGTNGGGSAPFPFAKRTSVAGTAKGKRVRRSPEQLAKDAKSIIRIIAQHKDIDAMRLSEEMKTQKIAAPAGTISAFIKAHAGVTVPTTGKRRSMIYHAPKA